MCSAGFRAYGLQRGLKFSGVEATVLGSQGSALLGRHHVAFQVFPERSF